MSARVVWFVAGAAAGVYSSVKAKRAAYRLSMPGLIDQAAALGSGVRAFRAEMAEGMHAQEQHVRARLLDHDHRLALPEPDDTSPEQKDPH